MSRRKGPGPRYSKYLALRGAALAYHTTNDDLVKAGAHLEQRLLGNFKTTRDNDVYLRMLDEYVSKFKALGTTFVRSRVNITVTLPEGYRSLYQVTGQIARLDLNPNGRYRAWLFAHQLTKGWQDDLKFPLIQRATANQLNVSADEVIPGVYDFSAGAYCDCKCSSRQIDAALQKLLRLLDDIKGYK